MKIKQVLFVIAFLLSACSRKSEEQLFKEAQEAVQQKNPQLSAQLYLELVDRFPKGKFADSSQFYLAMTYNNDLKDTLKALNAYRKVYELFPESKLAPTSLFPSGFLLNN